MGQLWIPFKKPPVHGPITEIKCILLEQSGEGGFARYRVKFEN
jgi:hypothetical protein